MLELGPRLKLVTFIAFMDGGPNAGDFVRHVGDDMMPNALTIHLLLNTQEVLTGKDVVRPWIPNACAQVLMNTRLVFTYF